MENKPEYVTPTVPKSAILALLQDRPIAYHPLLAKVLGGVKQAIFASQLLYWTGKGKRADGFIWKNQEEWTEETGLSIYEQRTARKHLVKSGVLQEKRMSIPARLYYRINTDVLQEVLTAYLQQDVDVVHICTEETSTTIPEITTPEITPEEPAAPDSLPADDDVAETEAMFTKTSSAKLSKEEFMGRHNGTAVAAGKEVRGSADIPGQPWCNEPVEEWCKLAEKSYKGMSIPTRIKLGGIFYKIGAATDSSPAQVAEVIGNFKAEHPWWKYDFDWPSDGFCNRLGMMLVPDAQPEPGETLVSVRPAEPAWLEVSP